MLYCHITECLLSIEIGDNEYAASRLKSIERKFKTLLNQSHNYRQKVMVSLLRKIIYNIDFWQSKNLRNKAWNFIRLQPYYKPGSEFISFNAWLYSKLENVPYGEAEYNKAIEERMNNGFLTTQEL